MQALVELTTEFPTVWTTSYSAKKPASQRLRQCMKRGSQAGPTEFWTLAWTLFSKLPVDILPKDYTEARDLLAALHDGLSQKEERFNASPAWTTYFKVADLIQEGEVGSRLSDGEHDKLTTEMVLPVVQQYLRPAQETVQWSILGAKASWNVSKTAYCRRLPPLLAKKWPEYATALAEEMKTSLPEQSKDFDKSQMAVAAAGERWALLQKEFLQGEYDIPESLRQAFAEANKTLVRESLQLLRNRNGKPYGAAAVVDELLNHCNEQVLGDQDTNNSITSFIKEDFSGMLNSPSQRQLLSLLYHFHNDSSFSEIWNKTASALANSPDSQEKTNAFRVLLSAPRVNPAAELALKNPDVQRYIQRQYESSISTNADWSFLAGVLKPYPTVASTDTTDAILANLTESLSISDKAALALEGLDEISKSNRALVKEFVTKPNGTQLLPGLLLLEESTDEAVAGKASNVSKRLMEGADQSSSQSALLGVVQQSLKEVSAKTLPMHAVLDMVARLLGQGDVPAEGRQELAGQLMPDVDVWRTALEPFWSKAPPPSLAVTNQLGGAVYLVKAQDASTKAPVARDAEGLSQALRLAVYSSRVFNQTALFEALDGECRREIFRLLYLTTLLANDNISVAGANNLWAAYNPDVEAEMVDFTSEAQRFIIHCMHHPTIGQADSPYAFVSDIIGNFRKEFGGFSPADFYGARMCCMAVGELVELHGHSANDMERWEGFLREARKERALLRLSACIAALRQPLWNNGQFNRYCNELVADLTGVNIGSKPEKALEDLVMLNTVLQSHKDAITVIAKQRVIFLVKHMLPWLEDEGVSTATKSEVFKSLSVLLPAMADIYGEHWVQVLSHIANAWSAGYVQADAPEVDDTRLPLVHASLKLYGALRSLKSSEDPNDDLVDAWKESQEAATSGLLGLLRQSQGVADELHQPLKITHELLAREIGKLPDPHVEDAGSLYPLLYTPAQAIQRTAFELLHRVIPAAQEQISFDAALENKTATLPEELLSLILEAPTADALADANFDSAVPLDLHGYLFSWLLVFDHFASSSYKVKSDYIDNLKEGTYLQGLLDFAFDFLGHVRGRPVDVSRFDIASYTPEMEASPERDVQWLLTHLYYLALTHLPSLTKSYYLSLTSRQTSLAVESWTAKFISPLIVSSSLGSVADWASSSAKDDPDYENFTVKVAMRSKEVNVSYVVDEQTMAIVVRLPETYPLEMARVEGVSRVAVDEKKWQSWLRGCQGVITFSVSTVFSQSPLTCSTFLQSLQESPFLPRMNTDTDDLVYRMATSSTVSRPGARTSQAPSRARRSAPSVTVSSAATNSCPASAAAPARTSSTARACTSGSRRAMLAVVRCAGMLSTTVERSCAWLLRMRESWRAVVLSFPEHGLRAC